MQIDFLANHPSHIEPLARLHQQQWGYLRPDSTLDERTARLAAASRRNDIPTVFIALEDGELRGSAMLIAHDMSTRPDLTPWLAGVYVLEAHRSRGIGSALVARVESEAFRLGVARLYLYTPDATAFYADLRWDVAEECEYLGYRVTVMSKQLGGEAS